MNLRIKYNAWLKELFKDKHYPMVANLGCCEDGDCIIDGEFVHSKGPRYMDYFTYDKVYHVDTIDYSEHYKKDNEIFLLENIMKKRFSFYFLGVFEK